MSPQEERLGFLVTDVARLMRQIFAQRIESDALTLAQARAIIKEVAAVTATWRETAKAVGARPAELSRMASAFEHDDLTRALAL